MATLLSTTQELQRVKQELAMTSDAKNQALNHADDATKIAEIHAEKAEGSENLVILKLKTEIKALKEELEKAKGYDDNLSERETFIEQLNVELEASKMAESYARSLLEEWHKKALLEEKNKLTSELENSKDEEEKSIKAMESLASALHEVFAEAREAKENLLNIQVERESYENQIEDLKLVLKATNEKYESTLDEARHEIDVLSMFQENDELQIREPESIKKMEELSKLLEEATTRNLAEENGDLTESEKDYDLLPKVVEFSEENGHVGEDISKVELSVNQEELKQNIQEESILSYDKAENIESLELEEIEKKELSPEREIEPESFEEEVNSKIEEGSESFDKINGNDITENIDENGTPPSKQQQLKKKNKPLLGKFGSPLKKKGASNQNRAFNYGMGGALNIQLFGRVCFLEQDFLWNHETCNIV
ncbi:hypothetical protein VNO78_05069 [Psophocarpus tetragonolobus]|uniref:Uncharacterized protein n=1 Tax=Psophocarpus tetragonolobus TaxID=3891 RepID=A0AAN9T086_PSOTE